MAENQQVHPVPLNLRGFIGIPWIARIKEIQTFFIVTNEVQI